MFILIKKKKLNQLGIEDLFYSSYIVPHISEPAMTHKIPSHT